MRTIARGEQRTSLETPSCGAMKVVTLLLLFLPLLVAGCTSGSVATPSPTPEIITIEAGGRLRIPVDPLPRAPEANPQVTLRLIFQDKVAKGPVTARSVALDARVVAKGVTEFAVMLPGSLDQEVVITIEAAGYRKWDIGFRWNIKYSRSFQLPVLLEPLSY
jgi:hypothetical protein